MAFNCKQLRKARQDKGISVESLASQVGVTRQTLVNYEKGETYPTVELLPRLAKELGQDILFFFKETQQENCMTTQKMAPEGAPVAAGATSQANRDPIP